MRLVTTTDDFAPYFRDRSVSAPLDGIKETGFRHIDLSMYRVVYPSSPWIKKENDWEREVDDALEKAQKYGFDFCQAHSPAGKYFEGEDQRVFYVQAIRNSIRACSKLGIRHTVLHAQGIQSLISTIWKEKYFFKKNKEFFELFLDDCEKYNVDLLIENTGRTWGKNYYLYTGAEMREFVDKLNSPRLNLCWDTGHGNASGVNQYDDIVAMGDKLHALHVQDNYGTFDSHVMPLVGTTNFDNVLRGLLKIGYQGDFTFEGCNTVRLPNAWPHHRRDISENDLVSSPPLFIQQKQIAVMYEVGKWMLEKYNIPVE